MAAAQKDQSIAMDDDPPIFQNSMSGKKTK